MSFDKVWESMTDEQKAEAERLYTLAVEENRSMGYDVRDLSVYEALSEYERDVDTIESVYDVMTLARG